MFRHEQIYIYFFFDILIFLSQGKWRWVRFLVLIAHSPKHPGSNPSGCGRRGLFLIFFWRARNVRQKLSLEKSGPKSMVAFPFPIQPVCWIFSREHTQTGNLVCLHEVSLWKFLLRIWVPIPWPINCSATTAGGRQQRLQDVEAGKRPWSFSGAVDIETHPVDPCSL